MTRYAETHPYRVRVTGGVVHQARRLGAASDHPIYAALCSRRIVGPQHVELVHPGSPGTTVTCKACLNG